MEKTWKPVVAGILEIVAGALGAFLSFLVLLGLLVFAAFPDGGVSFGFPKWLAIIGVLALSIVSIIGGVFALKRRIWGLALAGSITALFVSTVLGIAAIVFIVLSREEFTSQR